MVQQLLHSTPYFTTFRNHLKGELPGYLARALDTSNKISQLDWADVTKTLLLLPSSAAAERALYLL